MALKVIQQMKYCPNCNKVTVCNRNTKEMSWAMHIFLSLITFGIWILVWVFLAFFHGITKPIGGGWICGECGINTNYRQSEQIIINGEIKAPYSYKKDSKNIMIVVGIVALFSPYPFLFFVYLIILGVVYFYKPEIFKQN